MKATNFRPNTKVMLSSLLKVPGTGRSLLATRLCACRSKMADLKASMRISPQVSGYPVSSAQKCGDVLPRLQSPRMDRLVADDTGGTIWRIAYTGTGDRAVAHPDRAESQR